MHFLRLPPNHCAAEQHALILLAAAVLRTRFLTLCSSAHIRRFSQCLRCCFSPVIPLSLQHMYDWTTGLRFGRSCTSQVSLLFRVPVFHTTKASCFACFLCISGLPPVPSACVPRAQSSQVQSFLYFILPKRYKVVFLCHSKYILCRFRHHS